MTKRDGKRVSPWPQLTSFQRETMRDFDRSRYGGLFMQGGRLWMTACALVYKGLITGGSMGWYSLTQSGKDYIRFGMKRRKR